MDPVFAEIYVLLGALLTYATEKDRHDLVDRVNAIVDKLKNYTVERKGEEEPE